jgi:hypothetical protein
MINCSEMKRGEVYFCKTCGLELKVEKTCSCGTSGQGGACSVPLQCCGGDMQKK